MSAYDHARNQARRRDHGRPHRSGHSGRGSTPLESSDVAWTTLVYGFCHFCIDFACIAVLMGSVVPALGGSGAKGALISIVVYDMVAFCLQLPIGALLDVWGRETWRGCTLMSCGIVGLGVLFGMPGIVALDVLALVLISVGNALFHCAGGEEILDISHGNAGLSGAFISTGAAGVFLGMLSAPWSRIWVSLALLVLLALCVGSVLSLQSHEGGRGGLAFSGVVFAPQANVWLAVALLAGTVALRSYVGTVMAFPWKAEFAWAVAAIAAVVAGKAVGGFLSDGIGPFVAGAISLAGAAPLFLLSWQSPVAGVCATFLFNFTMAITLTALAGVLPRSPGLAFGIASFSLAIGAAPALLGFAPTGPGLLCVLSLVSLALLMAGLIVADRQDAGHVLPQTNRLNNPHNDGRTARRRGVANPRRRG